MIYHRRFGINLLDIPAHIFIPTVVFVIGTILTVSLVAFNSRPTTNEARIANYMSKHHCVVIGNANKYTKSYQCDNGIKFDTGMI